MKRINFIDSIPKNVHKEVKIWLLGTMLLCGTSLTGFVVINLSQIPVLYQTYYEYNDLLRSSKHPSNKQEEVSQLHATQKELRSKVATLKKYTSHESVPIVQLKILKPFLSDQAQLEKLSITSNNIDLSLSCRNPRTAQELIHKMKQAPHVEHLALASIQQNSQATHAPSSFHCTIKGTMITPKSA